MNTVSSRGTNRSQNPLEILLIEDNDIDVESIKRAFRKKEINNTIVAARDGSEALAILRGEHSGHQIQTPHIILLDLNLPRMNGFEFLDCLRRDPALCRSIVFVLTTSDLDEDKARAYGQNVAGYLLKTAIAADLTKIVTMLDLFWDVVQFPAARPN